MGDLSARIGTGLIILLCASCDGSDASTPGDLMAVRDPAQAQHVVTTLATDLVRNLLTSIHGPGAADGPIIGQGVVGASGRAVVYGYPHLVEIHGFGWYTTQLDATVRIEFTGYQTAASPLAVSGVLTCEWHSVESSDGRSITTTGNVTVTSDALGIDWQGDDPIVDRIQLDAHNLGTAIDRYTGALTTVNGNVIAF